MQPERTSKSIRGYQIVIILLVVVLGVLAFIYFRQVKSLKAEAKAEKAILEENINDLIVDLDNLKVDNDSISYNLGVERQRADSLMERLQNERNINPRYHPQVREGARYDARHHAPLRQADRFAQPA